MSFSGGIMPKGLRALLFVIYLLLPQLSLGQGKAFDKLPPLPELIFQFAAAMDKNKEQIVVFGGALAGGGAIDDTWVYSIKDDQWKKLDLDEKPRARTHHAMAYLPDKKRIYLFGGRDEMGNYLEDTWEFTGTKWKRLDPDSFPMARGAFGMAPTAEGDKIVLFGGFCAALGDLFDTWIFDGKKWERKFITGAPSPRSNVRLAPNPAQGGVLLFGGFGPAPGGGKKLDDLTDTWVFTGDAWQQLDTQTSPGKKTALILVPDFKHKGVYLYGRESADEKKHSLWFFNGENWTPKGPLEFGAPASEMAIFSSSKGGEFLVVMLPGEADEQVLSGRPSAFLFDTWAYDGRKWNPIESPHHPEYRTFASMAFDQKRGVAVLFGGSSAETTAVNDTWEFDGADWKMGLTKIAPPARFDHRLVYDEKSGRVILFGGFGPSEAGDVSFNDTWAYDGTTWKKPAPDKSPKGRSRHCLVWDSGRNRVLLFGGHNAADGELGDMWSFDGKQWSRIVTDSGPSPRSSAACAYNKNDGAIYLFGGFNRANGALDDAWRYDADNNKWTVVESKLHPPGRHDAGFVYDEKTDALTLFGGFNGKNDLPDLWVLVGGQWKKLDAPGLPPRSYFSYTYDQKRKQTLLFGGYGMESAAIKASLEGYAPTVKPGTWEFNGQSWKQIMTKNTPTADLSYAMAYDEKRKLTVLFGGYNETKGELTETWVYDGKDWQWIHTKNQPGKRTNASLVYDPQRKRVLLYGGYNPDSGALSDMWEFDGRNWIALPVKCPESNYTGGSNLVYDSKRKVFVMYGARATK